MTIWYRVRDLDAARSFYHRTLGFDEALYPRLMALDAVADASPVVQLRATLGAGTRPVTLLGLDVFRTMSVSPSLMIRPRAATHTADGARSAD